MKMNFKITGLDCANCAARLERILQKIEGIQSLTINFMLEKMTVELDENRKDEIIQKIKNVIKEEEPDTTIEQL